MLPRTASERPEIAEQRNAREQLPLHGLDPRSIDHNDVARIDLRIGRLAAADCRKVERRRLPLTADRPEDRDAPRIGVVARAARQRYGLDQGHRPRDLVLARLADRSIDGHDMGQVVDALDGVPFEAGRPSAIVAHTVKGKGVSFAEDTYVWHSNNVNDEIYERAITELGMP